MGVRAAYGLLRVVAAWYFLFAFRSSRIQYRYFRQRIGLHRLGALRSLYKNYYFFGQSLIDRVVMMAGIPQRFTFDFDGEENLRRIVAQGKGGLLLSAHIGNWEVAGHLFQRLGTRVNILMYDGEHQRIKQYLEGVTGERTARIILIRDDLSHIYEISEALRNKELVCIHADRFVAPAKTMDTLFLGEKAPFPVGPFLLASTYRVPVSFVFGLKEGSDHYHFYASEPRSYDFQEKRVAMERILEAFALEMEEKVKRYPEQWYNYYNFWHSKL
jgi:predicted LPLAT superfamily acyltransferase